MRVVAQPGGPGIKGKFPHIHPVLVETFQCISGEMTARVSRDISEVKPGEKVEVPAGKVHGFLNTGTVPLVVESEVIFPNGYRAEDDLMRIGAIYDRLRREGPVNPRTGEPRVLQMAVLVRSNNHVMRPPGVAGLLMGPLALIGRLRGYRSEFPEWEGT